MSPGPRSVEDTDDHCAFLSLLAQSITSKTRREELTLHSGNLAISQGYAIRVCHVIHTLAPGGAEHLLVDLARVASQVGIEMSVVSLMPTSQFAYHKDLRSQGTDVRSLCLASRWDPRFLTRAAVVCRAQRPDLLHAHLKHADLVTSYVAPRLMVPWVSTLHMIEAAPTPILRLKRRVAYHSRLRSAARTIAVSDALRRWYLEAFAVPPAGVVTIRNGVAPASPASRGQRTKIRRSLGVPEDAVVAAMVGIMRPTKGHSQLIAAAAHLGERSGVIFALIGDGVLRMELEQEACASGVLGRNVVFCGFREDVPLVLAACDLLVHPSLDDALPTALIHGLAAGMPIVASDVGGVSEIVTADCAQLVPPGDAEALAAAVDHLGRDEGLRRRMGAAASRQFRREFEVVLWAERLAGLYREVQSEYRGM